MSCATWPGRCTYPIPMRGSGRRRSGRSRWTSSGACVSDRAGLIGELGIGGLTAFEGISSFAEVGPNEVKVLRAAALAHHRTGVAISLHPPRSRARGVPRSRLACGALDLLERDGVPPDRVVVGHLDGSWDEDLRVH